MACKEFENRILEYLENQLPLAERPVVETHLAACTGCQAVARQLQQIDAALTKGIKQPTLPSDFSVRLRQRIQTGTLLLPETPLVERKRQLQAEFEAGLARLRRKSLNLTSLLDILGWAVLAACAGGLIWKLTPAWTNLAAQHGLDCVDQNLAFSWIISAGFILIGLTVAFPRPLKKLWTAI